MVEESEASTNRRLAVASQWRTAACEELEMAIPDDVGRREMLRQWRASGLPSREFSHICGV